RPTPAGHHRERDVHGEEHRVGSFVSERVHVGVGQRRGHDDDGGAAEVGQPDTAAHPLAHPSAQLRTRIRIRHAATFNTPPCDSCVTLATTPYWVISLMATGRCSASERSAATATRRASSAA